MSHLRGGPSRELLEQLYHGEKMSLAEIAQQFETTEATVSRWMTKKGVATRVAGVTKFIRSGCPSPEMLEDMYVRRQMSTVDMSVYFGVQPVTIVSWLRRYGIKLRSFSEGAAVSAKQGKRTQYKERSPDWRKAPTASLPEYDWPLRGQWQIRHCYDWFRRQRVKQWVFLLY